MYVPSTLGLLLLYKLQWARAGCFCYDASTSANNQTPMGAQSTGVIALFPGCFTLPAYAFERQCARTPQPCLLAGKKLAERLMHPTSGNGKYANPVDGTTAWFPLAATHVAYTKLSLIDWQLMIIEEDILTINMLIAAFIFIVNSIMAIAIALIRSSLQST